MSKNLPAFDESTPYGVVSGPSTTRYEQGHVEYNAQKQPIGTTAAYKPPAETGGAVTIDAKVEPPYDRFHASALNGEIKGRRGKGATKGSKKPDMIAILEHLDAEGVTERTA